jgi:hypothetical protein
LGGGARGEGDEDVFQHGVRLLKDFVVPVAQDAVAAFSEPAIAGGICLGLGVLSAVDLDDQFGFVTDEVGDVGPERFLATEFPVLEAFGAQHRPEPALGVGHVSAQVPGMGKVVGVVETPAVALSPGPSPRGGGGSVALSPGPSP